MARTNGRDRDRTKRVPNDPRPRAHQRGCAFCTEGGEWVDYKDVNLLRRDRKSVV